MKKVWITSLVRNEEQVGKVLTTAKQYGLDANGHFWTDDLKHMAWQAPMNNILDPDTSLWMILGDENDLESASVRYGLALLALAVQAKKGLGFHILWAGTQGPVGTEALPTPFRGADGVEVSNPSLGAKIVAKANTPISKIDTEYRLDVHANPGFGVWAEIGPGAGRTWGGAMLGVSGGGIDAHGVGDAGKIPQKTVLEYPMQGLKLALGETEYTAWAVQNKVDVNQSYYVRIQDIPKSLLFGPYAQDEAADVHVIAL